jgi:apolipoprotein N-acyltransferase
LLHAAISPPVAAVVIHPIVWVPALAVFSTLRGWRAFGAGLVTGTALHLALYPWLAATMVRFSNLPPAAGLAVLALFAVAHGLFVGVFAAGLAPIRRATGAAWPLAAAAWFTACEFLHPQIFPVFQGSFWYRVTPLFGVVSLTGVAGATFLVMLVNTVMFQAIASRRAALANAAIAAALIAGALAWSAQRDTRIAAAEARSRSVRVAIVQPNQDKLATAAIARAQPERVAAELAAQSRAALDRDPLVEVVVWPETALPEPPDHPINRAALALVIERGVELWTGAARYELDAAGLRRHHNAAYRVDRDGAIGRRYDKTVLVPFGEYVPGRERFDWLRGLRGPGETTPGDGLVVHDTPLARFAFLICYEAILAGPVREAARAGSELLVNLTYDGWFGATQEPHQHLMLAAGKAAEAGVPMVRATTTGVSALIDARGAIAAESRQGERDVLIGDVRPLRVDSPWSRFGDWFAWSTVVSSFAAIAFGSRRRA